MEIKRKTPLQLQLLERFYAEQKCPTQAAIEDLALALDLTSTQVRGWFVGKRKRDKSNNLLTAPPQSCEKGTKVRYEMSTTNMFKQKDQNCKRKKKRSVLLQALATPNLILNNSLKEDGSPTVMAFDYLPPKGFTHDKDSSNSYPSCRQTEKPNKRKKVSKRAVFTGHDCSMTTPVKRLGIGKGLMINQDCNMPTPVKQHGIGKGLMINQDCNLTTPVKRHGVGKGLMTVWHAMNPGRGEFPSGIQLNDMPELSTSLSRKTHHKKNRRRQPLCKKKNSAIKNQCKRIYSIRREVEHERDVTQMPLYRDNCELALEGVISEGCLNQFEMLMDDEDIELKELEAGPNPLKCSEHCYTNSYGCSLCKDLLPKFPPDAVKMKQPFTRQPLDSSPESVKKLFKVVHFLYTYSIIIDVCPFTLDEFAQAFHDKDSLLLGKIHVALLKLLLSDVQSESHSGLLPHTSISCNFLALLHSVENEAHIVDFWKNSLNPLTWTEILCQVLVASGFGSKQNSSRRGALSKEMSLMVKYGLRPRTLKGELFRLLAEKENLGSKVCDLAKSPRIAELNVSSSAEELELELLICSTLSSDITLFEKISSSAYRLRMNTMAEEPSDVLSDVEDGGSVHDSRDDVPSCSSESGCDSENTSWKELKLIDYPKSKNEIDESNPGEVWLLGLMDSEYSDLSIDEKLSALVALIDLSSAGPSIRMEDPSKPAVKSNSTRLHHGSGAKIKRSLSIKHDLPRSSWVHVGQMRETTELSKSLPVDSSLLILKFTGKFLLSSEVKDSTEARQTFSLHPMQSIYLGSDRRYNRYWLFLGPCHINDPGHRKLYFESSEDGHWEVIDTKEALHTLLSILDGRGTREARLIESLENREAFLCKEMSRSLVNSAECDPAQSDLSGLEVAGENSSSPVSDVDNNLSQTDISNDSLPPCGAIILEARKEEEENQKRIRLQQFDAWIWNFFYCDLNAVKNIKRSYYESLTRCQTCHDLYWRDEKHCKICHTTFELDFDLEERYTIHSAMCRQKVEDDNLPKYKVWPSQLQSLKAALHAIELAVPEDALLGAWRKSAHRLWVKRLRRTSSLAELLQVVADFVAAINEDWLYQWAASQSLSMYMAEITSFFPSMPHTTSALALWLVQLDNLISSYVEGQSGVKQLTGTEIPVLTL